MPSIEIICIGQKELVELPELAFPVEMEKELISHRFPKPLFQSDFDKLQGIIYHLLENEDAITAYDLLKRDWYNEDGSTNGKVDNIEFKEEYLDSVKKLFVKLLSISSVGQILFTSDYQFGPRESKKNGLISLSNFWKLHDDGKIRINSSYLIYDE